MISNDIVSTLQLIRTPGIGPRNFHMLVDMFGSAKEAILHVGELAKQGGRKKPLRLLEASLAEAELEHCEAYGGMMLTSNSKHYPALLKEISDHPPILTVKGNLNQLQEPNIAIVGARHASANGFRFARKLATDLGKCDMVVSSGLARGIDTAAHHGALESGTIAVVAGGINHIYPPENEQLFQQICEQGIVVAEMPFGTIPKAALFPRRNRIISGVSLGTVVVEAALNSGSLITARMALEQNREVMAVPGFPLDPRSRGTNSLLRQGAILIENADHIMEICGQTGCAAVSPMSNDCAVELSSTDLKQDEDMLGKARPIVYEKLGATPTSIDDIVQQTGFSVNIVQVLLLELELAGRATRQYGGKIVLTK